MKAQGDGSDDEQARLPVDRVTLACVAAGGALSATAAYALSANSTWRALQFDVRIVGLFVVSLLVGVSFAVRDVLGDRLFAFLTFGVLVGFTSIGLYAVISLIAMPPSAGVRFLFAAPIVAAAGTVLGDKVTQWLRGRQRLRRRR